MAVCYLVGILVTVEDSPLHHKLVLIDHHQHLLDHVVLLLVCHQGHVGATLKGLLFTVEDSPLHYEPFLVGHP